MSILIKGMEMPLEKSRIIQIYPDGTVRRLDGSIYNSHFEAVHVPPHGRLGDLDKQDAQIEALIERHLHGYTKSTWDFVCELRDILKRNPTVIPKESAEEEKNDE